MLDVIKSSLLAGSDECLMHDNLICHSTFCTQPSVKAPQGGKQKQGVKFVPKLQ